MSTFRPASVTDLGEVELEGIVSGQRHHEASGQVLWQWVAMVTEEQAVVTQRGHGDANLSQVVEILQHRGLRARGTRRQTVTTPLTLTAEADHLSHTLNSILPLLHYCFRCFNSYYYVR